MTGYDLLFTGGQVVYESGTIAADVAVTGERIAAVLPPAAGANAHRVVDLHGRFLLPGLIDSHVHFRTPGMTHKETWAAGSRAAVAGGITTVIDMPNTRPPMRTSRDAQDKHRMIEGTSLTDYRFHAGVDPARIEGIREISKDDASTVKVFLSGHHSAPDVVRDLADLDRLFSLAAELDRLLLFHAEDDAIFDLLDAWQGAPRSYHDYEPYRPRSGGIVAVARLIELARRHGTRCHVLHVSSREEADLLTAAAAAGIPVTFEVTAHHLTFTRENVETLGSRIRLRPAIRDAADRERLWAAVTNKQATTAGSDHAPHTMEEKRRPVADAPPGLPGVQELFPALYSGLCARAPDPDPTLLLPTVVRLLAHNPARLFGIHHRKGTVKVGLDADLVVFDPNPQSCFQLEDVHSACGWSAYEGCTFVGNIETVLRRGALVFERAAGGDRFGDPTGMWLDVTG